MARAKAMLPGDTAQQTASADAQATEGKAARRKPDPTRSSLRQMRRWLLLTWEATIVMRTAVELPKNMESMIQVSTKHYK
jgi:hypothetical protein